MNSSAYLYSDSAADAEAGDAPVRRDKLPEKSARVDSQVNWGMIVTPQEGTGFPRVALAAS